jgi:hypothetical protein
MSRKRPPPGDPPPDLPEGWDKWAIPPELYHDVLMPDDPMELQNLHIPSMGEAAAYARIEEVCGGVQRLINMVPTYLPLDGDPPQGPQLDGAGRRRLVNGCFGRINLHRGEWVALGRVLPRDANTALQTLARTIYGIWRRWERAEVEFKRVVAEARLAKKRGERLLDEVATPLRSIQARELTWLKQALGIVQEAVNAERSRKNQIREPKRKRTVSEEDEARSEWIYHKLCNINIK